MTFKELGLTDSLLAGIDSMGYKTATPVQSQVIQPILAGKDIIASAQTGTGKTAAFAIPILHHMYLDRQKNHGPRKIRALIVTPTRELAIQIRNLRIKVNNLLSKLREHDSYTLEGQAENARFDSLVSTCCFDEDGNRVFTSVDDYYDKIYGEYPASTYGNTVTKTVIPTDFDCSFRNPTKSSKR